MKRIFWIIVYISVSCLGYSQIRHSVKSLEDVQIIKENEYDRIKSNARIATGELGCPEIPVSISSYVVPIESSNITIEVTNMRKNKLNGTY